MEVGKSASEGLQAMNAMSEGDFKAFLGIAFQSLVDSKTTDAKEAKLPATSLASKQAFAATALVALEAAKHDASASELTSTLEEGKLADDRIKLFVAMYERTKATLRNQLAATSFSFATVVDISWRLDFFVKSDSLDAIRTPLYFITLKTQQPDGSLKDVKFTCNLQELQDLLFKLKDAEKQVSSRVSGRGAAGDAKESKEESKGREA